MNRSLRQAHRRAAWLLVLVGPAIVAALITAALQRSPTRPPPVQLVAPARPAR